MKKVLIATDKPFAASAVRQIREIIEKAGHQLVLLEKYTENSQLIKAVSQANAVIVRSDIISKEVLEASTTVEIIVRAGAGYDNIDLVSATAKNIVVMNTPGQNSNAVAELVFGMMVYKARKAFSGVSGTELRDKSIGIHAYGNVGKYVALIAKGFGMKIFAFDPYVSKEIMIEDGVEPVSTVEELYRKSQYLSLHVPANKETKQSINYNLLSLMPQNAVLVNTARKEVINEPDLLKILEEREDIMYLSDIMPDDKAGFEKFADRCMFTAKKMGAQTEEANVNAGLAASNQIVSFFETGDKKFQVNK